jgi:hypothetical protein
VTETMPSDDPHRTSLRRSGFLTTLGGRFLAIIVGIALVLAIAILSFLFGVSAGDKEVAGSKNALQKLQAENGRLTADNGDLQAKLADLLAQLADAQSTLDGLMPSANRFQIGSNQSLIVADGHLTIGLVGIRSDNVELNINNKQYSAAAGDVINVATDPSMTCRVEVMSFDVLKAVVIVNATCSAAKQ